MLITANQPFGEWGKVFPYQAMTLATIDRLMHHATILGMNVESYRRHAALERKRQQARCWPARQSRRGLIHALIQIVALHGILPFFNFQLLDARI